MLVRVRSNRTLDHCWWDCINDSHFGRQFGSSNKAKFGLITGAKIALEGIYPNDLKTRAHTKTCM